MTTTTIERPEAASALASRPLDRAAKLVPALRARAAEAELLRRLPEETIAELRASGLFKLMLPRRLGGDQASLHDFIDVVAEVGKGCGSTAWVLGVVNAHHWLLGLFPQQAQDEVCGAHPDLITSAVIGPRGRAQRVEGGYVVSGFWPFCSGSPAADWLMLGGEVVDAQGAVVDEGDFLVPVSAVTVKDDWDVTGLRATGSNSVVGKDVFVPAHRFLSLVQAIGGKNPGAGLHEGHLYDSAVVPVLALGIVPAALGIAQAALDNFRQRLPGRIVSYTLKEVQSTMPTTHMQVADAASKIDAARLLFHRCAEDVTVAADSGQALPLLARARCRMDCAQGVRLCLEAVEVLYLASGGSGLAAGSPLQRASRDLHAINMHGLLCLETNKEMYGRLLLDLPQNTPLI